MAARAGGSMVLASGRFASSSGGGGGGGTLCRLLGSHNLKRWVRAEAHSTAESRQQPPEPYYFFDGCRFVRPYWFRHRARAMGHWVGQPLLAMLTAHFHRHPPAFYVEAIEAGRITVNGQPATPDRLFGAQDELHHEMHIHEPAVTSEPVQILHASDELVVVNKPAGLPCHAISLYRHNTLAALLRAELGLDTLSCANRLDAPVSGVVLFPRTKPEAQKLHAAILAGRDVVEKTYVARVRGRFPTERVECAAPLLQAETGVSIVDQERGKPSFTAFEHRGYDSATDTSLVTCWPTTGRRHQIRAHLGFLGFPIANDALYGGGPLVRSRAEFLQLKRGTAEDWSRLSAEELTRFKDSQPERFVREQLREEDRDAACWNCRKGLLHSFRPQAIWLHAHRYAGAGWSFTAPLPSWASSSS